MKQVVSWGLFVKHHKGSSCHKTRNASVCCFYQRVYHMAPSTGDPRPIKKRKRKTCKPKAVTLIRSHTVMTRHPLMKSSGKYNNLEEAKPPRCTFYYRYLQGLLSIFAKRKRMKNIFLKTGLCLGAKRHLLTDPNSWKERQHIVLADQCILDFDETKWAHQEI